MFSEIEVQSIISKHTEKKASLGRFPPPTPLAVQVSEAIVELIDGIPGGLILGNDASAEEPGHIAFSVLDATISGKLDQAVFIGFSGGGSSKKNFDEVAKVVKPLNILARLNSANFVYDSRIAFMFVYFESNSGASTPCGEPKALYQLNKHKSKLNGVATRWATSSQLSTVHRVDISFLSARFSFMFPCESCVSFLENAGNRANIEIA